MFVSMRSLAFQTWLRRLRPFTLLLMMTHVHLIHAQELSTELDLTRPEDIFALAQKEEPMPHGVDINVVNDEHNNALHLAAKNNAVAAASWLINQGIRINYINGWHKSPLHYAAQYGDLELVELLARSGARVNLGDTSNILERIAYSFASRKRYISPSEGTPLHLAIFANNEAISDYLITHGAHINATSSRGETPLYKAAERNQFALARLLIVNGADISKGSDLGKDTPLHQVLQTEEPDLDFAKYLINQGAPIELKDALGRTPLYYAIKLNDMSVAFHLIEQGADIFARDNNKETLLHAATSTNHNASPWEPRIISLEMTKFLVSSGIDVNEKMVAAFATTPLHGAVEYADLDVVRYLVEQGADLEALGTRSETPLLQAMVARKQKPALAIVKFLVERGANIHAYYYEIYSGYYKKQMDLMSCAQARRKKEPDLYDYVVSLFQ